MSKKPYIPEKDIMKIELDKVYEWFVGQNKVIEEQEKIIENLRKKIDELEKELDSCKFTIQEQEEEIEALERIIHWGESKKCNDDPAEIDSIKDIMSILIDVKKEQEYLKAYSKLIKEMK